MADKIDPAHRTAEEMMTIPKRLLRHILEDASPEMNDVIDEVIDELKVIDACNVGILAAHARAANQARPNHPEWLYDIATILQRAMNDCHERIWRSRHKHEA